MFLTKIWFNYHYYKAKVYCISLYICMYSTSQINLKPKVQIVVFPLYVFIALWGFNLIYLFIILFI